ncbi:uncharacterized protein LOC126419436 [Schistocerca serialis cubense]|uniref:uncharacterized protein LOC126419436 n=1 Tax=Schistocerca serialis cubense TaxID=2023355 RepID=UPI00214F614E|nr:uncharacterized protein LOC126419436 [Schistocerca serialis cubense]
MEQLKNFLGIVSFYRWLIKDFSWIMEQLRELLKGANYKWSTQQEAASQELLGIIFIISTNDAKEAISALLSQGELGQDLTVAFASRMLNCTEKNISLKWLVHIRDQVLRVLKFRIMLAEYAFEIICRNKS